MQNKDNQAFIIQCANCHEEWDKPRSLTDTCDCGFKLDSTDYLANPSFTVAGQAKWLAEQECKRESAKAIRDFDKLRSQCKAKRLKEQD